MKKGFTLIELSIVLIIIGVLVGGILIGQSLIDSVRTSRLVSNIGQYEIAVKQFEKKFKKYPGDSPFFSPPGTGDDSLWLGAAGAVSCAGGGLTNFEPLQVWAHLSQSGMLSKNYPAYDDTNCGGKHDYTSRKNIVPNTKVENYNGIMPINVSKQFVTDNLAFEIYTDAPNDKISLQAKLGQQIFDGTFKQQGLALMQGTGTIPCQTTGTGGPRCRVIGASPNGSENYAFFYYFLPPK